jgi:hypothetical protein
MTTETKTNLVAWNGETYKGAGDWYDKFKNDEDWKEYTEDLDPDELLPRLRAKQQQVRILLLAEPIVHPAIGDDARISMQVLDLNDAQLLHQLNPFV